MISNIKLTGAVRMEWDAKYEHGVIWQDLQHKELVEKMHQLLDSIIEIKKDKEIFYDTIKFLKDYHKRHFLIEEEYMIKHKYTGFKDHYKEHKYFTWFLNDFISQSIYREIETSVELLNECTNWFGNHIKTSDKLFAQFLLENQIT